MTYAEVISINITQKQIGNVNDKRYRGHVSTKTVDAQFISHYAFQSGNRSSSSEILQTHRDKAAPFDETKIVSGS